MLLFPPRIKKHVAAVAALESEVGNPNAAVCGCMIEFRSDLQSWAKSVKANKNAHRTLESAHVSVTKLNALGYCPLLFVGRHGRKGVINGDMVHHIPVNDEVVREILKKMGMLYEHLLKTSSTSTLSPFLIFLPLHPFPPSASPPFTPFASSPPSTLQPPLQISSPSLLHPFSCPASAPSPPSPPPTSSPSNPSPLLSLLPLHPSPPLSLLSHW
ncbi:unnamed protein product [Boreogadus saida]